LEQTKQLRASLDQELTSLNEKRKQVAQPDALTELEGQLSKLKEQAQEISTQVSQCNDAATEIKAQLEQLNEEEAKLKEGITAAQSAIESDVRFTWISFLFSLWLIYCCHLHLGECSTIEK